MTTTHPIQISVGDLVFNALLAGPEDGELIVLLHGFPQSAYEYRHQIPSLAAMGFRVLAPNQRGYSPGARPDHVAAYTVPNLVGDVLGLATKLGHDRFHLVGHDWGAAVAWYTAIARPERLISLVPISVPHPNAFQEAFEDPNGQQAQMSRYMDAFRARGAADLLLANDAAGLRNIYQGACLAEQDVQAYLSVLGTPEALDAALNWYRAMLLVDGPANHAPIRTPTMYVWSTDDVALGREGAELTAKYVEGPFRFEVLEGITHWVPEAAADRLNQLLREHFAPYARDPRPARGE